MSFGSRSREKSYSQTDSIAHVNENVIKLNCWKNATKWVYIGFAKYNITPSKQHLKFLKITFFHISREPHIALQYNLCGIEEHKITFHLTCFKTLSDFLFLGYKRLKLADKIPFSPPLDKNFGKSLLSGPTQSKGKTPL